MLSMKNPIDWYAHSIANGVSEEHALKVLSDALEKSEAKAKKKKESRRKINEAAAILATSAALSAVLIVALCALSALVECIASHI